MEHFEVFSALPRAAHIPFTTKEAPGEAPITSHSKVERGAGESRDSAQRRDAQGPNRLTIPCGGFRFSFFCITTTRQHSDRSLAVLVAVCHFRPSRSVWCAQGGLGVGRALWLVASVLKVFWVLSLRCGWLSVCSGCFGCCDGVLGGAQCAQCAQGVFSVGEAFWVVSSV